MTKRETIDLFRQKLREQTEDSTYSNFMIYKCLEEQAKWLIRRDISKVYRSDDMFQVLYDFRVFEVPRSECGIDTNCKIYRTIDRLPDMWNDDNGPIIQHVASLDFSTPFTPTTLKALKNKLDDPYQKIAKEKYYYFLDGYLYFTDNPHLVNISALFKDELSLFERHCTDCDTKKECVRFLDTRFMVPEWLQAEMQSKALQMIFQSSKRTPEDSQIDKNTNKRG